MGMFERAEPDEDQQKALSALRSAFAGVECDIKTRAPNCRERSLALTRLEEAAMWASKAVTHGKETPA